MRCRAASVLGIAICVRRLLGPVNAPLFETFKFE